MASLEQKQKRKGYYQGEGTVTGGGVGLPRTAKRKACIRNEAIKNSAKKVLSVVSTECSKARADPLRIAREQRKTLSVSGGHLVTIELVKLLLEQDSLLDRLPHAVQTSLLLLLKLEEESFFPDEWSKVVELLTATCGSSGERQSWKETFKDISLWGVDESSLRPFSTPTWLLDSMGGDDSNKGVLERGCKESLQALSASQDDVAALGSAGDAGMEQVVEKSHSNILQLLSSFEEEGVSVKGGMLQLRSLLAELSSYDEDATLPPNISDDVLSRILTSVLEEDTSLADVTLYFKFLLRSKALALQSSPSQTFTKIMKSAADAHPRIFSEMVLEFVVGSASFNAAQLELFRKVVRVKELSRSLPELLQRVTLVKDWNEHHVIVMQQIISLSSDLIDEQTLSETCSQMRIKREVFSSSLHFAKLINTIAQKFPKEARVNREKLLEALEINTTFFGKTATSKLTSL